MCVCVCVCVFVLSELLSAECVVLTVDELKVL